jgi:uncharacterized membrane protein
VLVALVEMTGDGDPFLGGWHVQAFADPRRRSHDRGRRVAPLFAWFAARWNQDGPLARSLGRASFAAYILHAPVVVSLSALLSSVAVVPEVKLVVVALLGVPAAFAAGWFTTRVPFLARLV